MTRQPDHDHACVLSMRCLQVMVKLHCLSMSASFTYRPEQAAGAVCKHMAALLAINAIWKKHFSNAILPHTGTVCQDISR